MPGSAAPAVPLCLHPRPSRRQLSRLCSLCPQQQGATAARAARAELRAEGFHPHPYPAGSPARATGQRTKVSLKAFIRRCPRRMITAAKAWSYANATRPLGAVRICPPAALPMLVFLPQPVLHRDQKGNQLDEAAPPTAQLCRLPEPRGAASPRAAAPSCAGCQRGSTQSSGRPPPPVPIFHTAASPHTALLRLAPGLSHQQIPLRLNPPPSPPCPAPSWALWRRARFQPGGAAGRAAVDRCRANRRRLLWGAVGAQGSAGGTTRGRTAASPDESVKPPPRRLRAQSHSRNTEGTRGPMRANEPKYGDLR